VTNKVCQNESAKDDLVEGDGMMWLARMRACFVFLVAAAPAAAGTTSMAPAAKRAPIYQFAWAPKPVPATPWIPPNRPHWKLSQILARHNRKASWSQTLVVDPGGLTAKYIQMGPGEKTKTIMYADTGVFWIIEAGKILFTIKGQSPFVASKGFMVQVPYRVPFNMETVGNEPSLRFEVTRTGALPLYPINERPTQIKGVKYIKVAYASAPGTNPARASSYLDFYKDVAPNPGRTPRFITIDTTAANINRQPAVPRPADSDRGHFHIGTSEFFSSWMGR
jgi:mannose-6-phosphate isomerase-like protein (cupin superfamily)